MIPIRINQPSPTEPALLPAGAAPHAAGGDLIHPAGANRDVSTGSSHEGETRLRDASLCPPLHDSRAPTSRPCASAWGLCAQVRPNTVARKGKPTPGAVLRPGRGREGRLMSPEKFDADLQSRIDEATLRLMFPASREDCMRAMDELRELKVQQRPERVEQLERERGLR